MDISLQLKPENLKDIFYSFGIVTTFIIGITTVIITIKNRKNPLRESLYKEQMNFISQLTTQLYVLHSDLTKMNNNHNIDIETTKLKMEKIFDIMFSNTHIASENILLKLTELLSAVQMFLNELNNNAEKSNLNFATYFNKYLELVALIRTELGINVLSKENEKLFK